MRKLIIFIFFSSHIVNAQQQKLFTNDSLLIMFQQKKTFEVLNNLGIRLYELDLKNIYSDSRLKQYLMNWLSKEEYFNYCMDEKRNSYLKDSAWIRDKIAEKLKKQKGKIQIDSILKNKVLFKNMRDSIIMDFMAIVITENKKFNLCSEPPYEAIVFHSSLAYPESYVIIRKLWKETGEGMDNMYFMPLIKLGDPEAQKLYDQKIKDIVKMNGLPEGMNKIYSELKELGNSYSISKMKELLKVDQNFVKFSDGDQGEPFRCVVFKYLIDEILSNSIALDKSIRGNVSCKEYLEHSKEVTDATKELVKIYKQKELYWMKNMPFYKGEGELK